MCDDVCYNAPCSWDGDDCTVAEPEPEDYYYSLGDYSDPGECDALSILSCRAGSGTYRLHLHMQLPSPINIDPARLQMKVE